AAHSPLAALRRLFTATRSSQTGVPLGRLRSSGSRVRLPVRTTTLMLVAATCSAPLSTRFQFPSLRTASERSLPPVGMKAQRAAFWRALAPLLGRLRLGALLSLGLGGLLLRWRSLSCVGRRRGLGRSLRRLGSGGGGGLVRDRAGASTPLRTARAPRL